MNKIIPLAALLIFPGMASAQIPKINLSSTHVQAIEDAKDPVKKLNLYRKFHHKDSVKTVRKYEARLKRKSDSLTRVMQNLSANEQKVRQKLGFLNRLGFGKLMGKVPVLPDTKNLKPPNLNSSAQGLDKNLQLPSTPTIGAPNEVGAIASAAGNYNQKLQRYDSGSLKRFQTTDSLQNIAQSQAAEKIEKKATSEAMTFMGGGEFQKYQKQMELMKSQQSQNQNQAKQLTDSASIKKNAKAQSEKLAQKYLNEHPELLKGIQQKMNQLMRKYSTVPNSNDLSTAVKRTSLKGRTFLERLVVAANFQIMNLRPLSIDFSPQLGYKFNSRFVLGVAAAFRKTFMDSIPHVAPQVLGFKGFSSYDIIKNFFAYSEFDRNSTGLKVLEGKSAVRQWQNNWLLGVGKKVRVYKNLDMTVVVLYNVFHKTPDPIYPKPFMVRIGFQLSELALLKRKVAIPGNP
jgi:hypothetical protein